jgi:hypothetical protein
VNADLDCRFRTPNGEMQDPTFHIGWSAKASLHFQFGPDGYSRFWYAVAILGDFFLSGFEHSTREKRGPGEERKREGW